MPPLLFLLLFLTGQLLTGTALAASQPSPERLTQLNRQISQLQQSLVDTNRERRKANDALRQADLRISEISRQQDALRQQQQATQARQQALLEKQKLLLEQKQKQVQALVELVQQHYAGGREERLKLLLNQQDPERMARLLQYQHYFEQARSERIHDLNESLTSLDELSQQLLATQQQLEDDRQALARRQQDMEQAREERRKLLASLDAQLGDKQQRLKQLKADSRHLEKLLEGMQEAISDIPADLDNKPFSKLAKKLPWPVSGKLNARYRDIRSGDMRWDGVVIAAKRGTPVRAIYPGRVIYADWLPGYGLMTIIDQGKGYMTLYGYNESLTRKVGDWVSAGDVIAHAGDSGGHKDAGLYFGIRHNGKPVNPEHWCNRHVTLPTVASH